MRREIGIIGMIICIGIGFGLGWVVPVYLLEEKTCPDCPDCPDCPECPECPVEPEETLVDLIIARGELIVGTSADFPPFENYTWPYTGEIEGFDVDLSQWIADELGVNLTMKDIAFDSLISACNASTIDIIAAAMSYTEGRAGVLAPSITYLNFSQIVIVKNTSSLTPINDLTDLIGYKVGCQLGSILESELVDAGVTPIIYDNASSLIQDLIDENIDAVYVYEPIFTIWSQTEDLRVIYKILSSSLALWCRYGEPELLYLINKVIFEAYLSGAIYNLMKTWFG